MDIAGGLVMSMDSDGAVEMLGGWVAEMDSDGRWLGSWVVILLERGCDACVVEQRTWQGNG